MLGRSTVRNRFGNNGTYHRFMRRVTAFALALTLLTPTYSAHAQNPAKRVLLLLSYNFTYPGIMSIGQGAMDRLRDGSPEKLELLSEFLDLARFPNPVHESRVARYLADKYAAARPDVVITAGREASQFLLKHRDTFAPDVPIVACCLPPETFSALGGSTKLTGVVSARDISKTLDLAERLQPRAHNLVVVAGSTDFDREWVQVARGQIAARERSYDTTYLVGLPYDVLINEVSRLPRDTIVITLTYFADDGGGRYISSEVIRQVARAASAPVYSPYSTNLGFGLVGGYSDLEQVMGAHTADLALQILAGKDPTEIPLQLSVAGAYRVDARQLERWQLSDAALPAGTAVSFREATLWDEHRYLILLVIAALSLQSAIIGYVLVQNRKRRSAERLLAENEERMAFAAASTNTGLWQFQAKDNLLWATKYCRSMLGLTDNAQLRLDTVRDSIHPDDRPAFVSAITEATSHSRPIDGEFRVALPSGEHRWIAVKGYPRRDEKTGCDYVNGIFNDVTALRTAEGDAELHRREVSRLMRQSVLGELSGTIAHELNQPLTAILANAEAAQDLLARKTIDLRQIREIVTDIIDEDTRAGEVISRIRKLLRKGESKWEPVDLNQLIDSTLRLLHGELVKRKIRVDVAQAPSLPTISGDSVQLQQVLLNIIMNAMEAVSENPPSQRIITLTTRTNADQIEAVVTDSGHGVTSEDQAQLFQPFFTTKEHGLGLGLSICSTIVKSHGGKLSIKNGPGGGAAVLVTLPTHDILVSV